MRHGRTQRSSPLCRPNCHDTDPPCTMPITEAERAFAVLFNVLGIEAPDRERLAFYLRLDPLTWG
uniref:Uncharacterized protein n=1 Tax=Pasteurella multocida TaxID=747 RepID=A0A7G1HN42_PASMD|nr:hypothetical protein 1 [Pasteurella multocida]